MATTKQMNIRTSVLSGAILGGLAQTATIYIFAAVFRMQVTGVSHFLGGLFTNDTAAAVRNGRIILAIMAILWGMFLYRPVRTRLPRHPYAKGVVFGLLIWAVSTGLILPLLSVIQPRGPAPGLFAFGFGGLSATVVSLVAHIVYGVVLSLYVEADPPQAVPNPGPA